MMKIHIDSFFSNNPELTLNNVVHTIKIGKTNSGIVNVWFETKDKYIDVNANGSSHGPYYSGNSIILHPEIWDGERYIEQDQDEYYDHPDYWFANLVVELEHTNYIERVTALKHEYFVTYVPDSQALNYECLKPAELAIYDERLIRSGLS